MLLSVCMIVKNEAQALPTALGSVVGYVDEIVVVDTGSSDGTQDLAAAAGARVLAVPWQDDFSHARNAALAAARGCFCLILDADEEVVRSTWPALLACLHEPPRDLYRAVVESETESGLARGSAIRVCRRADHIRYHGRVHEQLSAGPAATVGASGLVVRHHGYTAEALQRKGTRARNLSLLQAELAAHPHDPYLHFQIGATLQKTDSLAACRHFLLALEGCQAPDGDAAPFGRSEGRPSGDAAPGGSSAVSPGGADAPCGSSSVSPGVDAAPFGQSEGSPKVPPPPYLPSLILNLGYALRDSGRQDQALALLRTYLPRFADFTDLWFLAGLLHMDGGRATDMLRCFRRCLELGDAPSHYGAVVGAGSFRAHHNLGLFHELAGLSEVASVHYQAALRAAPDFQPTRAALARLAAAPALAQARG